MLKSPWVGMQLDGADDGPLPAERNKGKDHAPSKALDGFCYK